MVDVGLAIGGVVGVALSAGFIMIEVGNFATPQVPETLFEERREIFAYTAGLFVGIPLVLILLIYLASMANGAFLGAILWLVVLVALTEATQWALLRSRYWGHGDSGPFYALGYRAGLSGIFGLAIVAQYLASGSLTIAGVALALLQASAILALEVAGALLSVPATPGSGRRRGGPVAGGLFSAVGLFLIGLGPLAGPTTATGEPVAFAAALLALLGGILVYRRLRPILSSITAPGGGPGPLPSDASSYGRTDRRPGTPPT